MTLRELHEAAIRNVPANHPKETMWFRWWLLRGGLRKSTPST
jgi:hypothetical protein